MMTVINENYSNMNGEDFSLLKSIEDHIRFNLRYVDETVSHDSLFDNSKTLLLKLFGSWKEDEISLSQCKNGITNKLIKCVWKEASYHNSVNEGDPRPSKELTVLVRVYGKKSELLIDRQAELYNFISLGFAHLAPPIYGRFKNGLVYGYISGSVLLPTDMAHANIFKLIACKMASWHNMNRVYTRMKNASLFITLNKWFHGTPTEYEDDVLQTKYSKFINLTDIRRKIDTLQDLVIALDSPIVFCHNDLLSANIILNDDQSEVSFIDYEYVSYNYRGFDIANHFCEYAGFDCDYSKLPDREFQLKWIEWYLEHYLHGSKVTKGEIEKIYNEVKIFSTASHLYWGLWALVQAKYSNINFDYMDYAMLRFNQCQIEWKSLNLP